MVIDENKAIVLSACISLDRWLYPPADEAEYHD
jgi:hypothetical protein